MELMLVTVGGVMLACSIYAFMMRGLLRALIGFVLLSNAVNVFVFLAGRVRRGASPLVPDDAKVLLDAANPLPQALMLTAVVISFSMTAFAFTLTLRVYRNLGTMDGDELDEARDTERSRALSPDPSEDESSAHAASDASSSDDPGRLCA